MDMRKFKSISINETESSNGEREVGGVFSGRLVGIYVFITEDQIAAFRPSRIVYWNERCAVWLPERVKSFLETVRCGKKKKSWDGFVFHLSSSCLWFIFYWREDCEAGGWWHQQLPYLITGWRFDAYGGKMEDDGRVLLWNADQSNASCGFGPNITDLLHFFVASVFGLVSHLIKSGAKQSTLNPIYERSFSLYVAEEM